MVTDKSASGGAVKSKIMWNQELAEKLHNLIIRKFKNQVQSTLIFYRQYLECSSCQYAINKQI